MAVELPLELEREIFEWAARESQTIAHGLVFIAHRVKAWYISTRSSFATQ